eukprot:gb/GFBE01047952.1/.p1 GENE.gb/GFBE01047952.1/~~gb/GFBE01047952.1/.p1  ORF type:complete len:365 (+),score=74.35 gb/GFBE01047952.1/:1-1095(+)
MALVMQSEDAAFGGVMLSAVLPLMGACYGLQKVCCGAMQASEEVPGANLTKYTFVGCFMVSVCALYGFIGAFVISANLHKDQSFLPGYACNAAGLMNGVAGAVSAVGQGIFMAAAMQAGARQPRVFVGAVLIMIYIEAFALYGLIVSLYTVGQAPTAHSDMAAAAVVPFSFVFISASVGGIVGSTVCGLAIMEISVDRPDLLMKGLIPIVFNGVTGIYGLLNAMIDVAAWPPAGHDWRAGLLYLISSVGLGYVGYTGVKALPADPSAFVAMCLRLVGSQSIGLLGLIYGLTSYEKAVQGDWHKIDDFAAQEPASFAPATLLGEGLVTHQSVASVVLVLFLAPLCVACFLGVRRRQPELEVSLLA